MGDVQEYGTGDVGELAPQPGPLEVVCGRCGKPSTVQHPLAGSDGWAYENREQTVIDTARWPDGTEQQAQRTVLVPVRRWFTWVCDAPDDAGVSCNTANKVIEVLEGEDDETEGGE